MSPQLKLSAIASVVALALFAVAGQNTIRVPGFVVAPHAGFSAAAPKLPTLGNLLPSRQ